MTETAATPKKTKAASKAKKPKTAPTHPKVADMVNAAIGDLKERGGSSLQAIKKYISAKYKVDADKLAPFIRKYLKSAVVSGGLVQTKGKGASGSFRMGGSAAAGGKKSGKAKKKSITTKKPKAVVTAKKAEAKPKKSPAKSKPKKSPAKKPKAAAAKKPKAAKKAKPAKKASPKKKAASKKAKK